MKKFALLLFSLLFIAATCLPAFAGSCSKGWERTKRGRYIAARNHVERGIERSSRARKALYRAWARAQAQETQQTEEQAGSTKEVVQDTATSK